jgi:hypothetical protein
MPNASDTASVDLSTITCCVKYVHSAEVDGNVGISVLGATNGWQHLLGKC